MAETTATVSGAKKTSRGLPLPLILLVVVLVIAAAVAGLGLKAAGTGSTAYGCMTLSQQGSNVQVVTSGIIHLTGTQYYITCAEGDTEPTTAISLSCLTITPHLVDFSYPGESPATWYYLTAPGHTITAPSVSTNSSEVLQPGNATIQVSC